MQILCTEAIVLKVIDFREFDQIITAFSLERGIVKWIYKKRSSKKKPLTKISPLMKGEFIYLETKGEIWKCREFSLLNYSCKLRDNYDWLLTAGKLIHWILASQALQKPASRLYRLLSVYLEKIPFIPFMKTVELSFLIKLLQHEGLLNPHLHCLICQKPLQSLHIMQGEHYCRSHAPPEALIFQEDETLAWLQIAACQTFSELQKIPIPETLPAKAEALLQVLLDLR